MALQSPYKIGNVLSPNVDGVRVSKKRITVAFAPEEKHVESFPEEMYETVMDVIEDSPYQHEYSEASRHVAERHEWAGGRSHNPVLESRKCPAGYELQISFVKPKF